VKQKAATPAFLARCDDGKRFVVHADEKLRAFLEMEAAIRVAGGLLHR